MINYKKKIIIAKYPSGDWYINTDRGDRYECFAITNTNTPWTQWWGMQNQSSLREWQKDMMRPFATKILDMEPYIVYKKNHGHNQAHDVMLCHSEFTHLWFLSTTNDFWIIQSDYGQIELPIEDSLGSVLERTSRDEIWKVYENLLHHN